MDDRLNLEEHLITKKNQEIQQDKELELCDSKLEPRKLKTADKIHLSQKLLIHHDDGVNYFEAIKNLTDAAIPSILSVLFVFLYDNLNIIFANKFLDRNSVSAIGMGTLYINATGFFVGLGLIGGVDTLSSQAFGAKSYYLMGLYVNISRMVVIGFFIFVCLPFVLASEYVLELIKQPQEIILFTSYYIKSMIPSVFFSLQFYVSIHYLQAMKIFYPGMLITFITVSLHSVWLYLFVGVLGMEIKGVGFSMGLTNFLNFCIVTAFIHYHNPQPDSNFCFDHNSISFKRIFDYLKMAVPSAIMFSADWLGFHILVLYSSYLDLASLAANVSIFSFIQLLFSIPMGISFACCIFVGNMIGSNKVKSAKIYAIIACILGVSIVFLMSLIIFIFREPFAELYTNDPLVHEYFYRLLSFLIVFATFDALQLVLNGVLKGLGKQKPASLLTLIIMYPINIPMCLTLAFSINYGLIGLWYSQLNAVIFLDFAYIIMTICLDWDNNAQRTIVKIMNFSEKLKKKTQKLEQVKPKNI